MNSMRGALFSDLEGLVEVGGSHGSHFGRKSQLKPGLMNKSNDPVKVIGPGEAPHLVFLHVATISHHGFQVVLVLLLCP